MTLKQKLLMGTGALTLAALAVTGALATGLTNDSGAACPKSDCGTECPKKTPCPFPSCPGC